MGRRKRRDEEDYDIPERCSECSQRRGSYCEGFYGSVFDERTQEECSEYESEYSYDNWWGSLDKEEMEDWNSYLSHFD